MLQKEGIDQWLTSLDLKKLEPMLTEKGKIQIPGDPVNQQINLLRGFAPELTRHNVTQMNQRKAHRSKEIHHGGAPDALWTAQLTSLRS